MNVQYIECISSDDKVKKINNRDFSWENKAKFEVNSKENIFSIRMLPMCNIKLKAIRVVFEYNSLFDGEMLSNGYQTWTRTKYLNEKNKIKKLSFLAKPFNMKYYGDYTFYESTGEKGKIYSHEFTCLRNSNTYSIFGSLNQEVAYTIFEKNYNEKSFSIYIDVDGLNFTQSNEIDIAKIYYCTGNNQEDLWKDYFHNIKGDRKPGDSLTGWTSWYYYYTNISHDNICENVKQLEESKIPFDVFQIDDGYQLAVGDWLNVNNKFNNGMKVIADEIKKSGFKPGIWLAPFICEKNSFIYKEKQEWILRDKNNKLQKVGWNNLWSGDFYALDLYNKEFNSYIRKVFRTIFDEWGYEMVKLDFLYAVNLLPRDDKTRAMVMNDALKLINEEVGTKKVLGCGIPIGSAMGKVDYCRIGADVAGYWRDKKLEMIGYRERVSTKDSLYNTIHRYCMNKYVFSNDPDVFILRKDKNKLTEYQKYTLFFINNMLGDLVFFSDDISSYCDKEITMIKSAYPIIKPDKVIINESKKDLFDFKFTIKNREYVAYTNMSELDKSFMLPKGLYYSKDTGVINEQEIVLKEGQTICFYILKDNEEGLWVFTDGYIYPGTEVIDTSNNKGKITVNFAEGFINKYNTYVVSSKNINLTNINDKIVKKIDNKNINIWVTKRI
jgi:alpha-galactosidase